MLQWGSLGFHKKSLANLAEAMKRTRKLCAIMIDSVGRELIINRPSQEDEDGWPTFEAGIAVEANQKAGFPLHPDPNADPATHAQTRQNTGAWADVLQQ